MWPFNLSVRLPIVDLVGRYPANYLIGRESIFEHISRCFGNPNMRSDCIIVGISSRFQLLFPTQRQVTHALLTRPPLSVLLHSVRLECVMHAASVHPEPGSNSRKIVCQVGRPTLKSFELDLLFVPQLAKTKERFTLF